jgi:hypothetical protein
MKSKGCAYLGAMSVPDSKAGQFFPGNPPSLESPFTKYPGKSLKLRSLSAIRAHYLQMTCCTGVTTQILRAMKNTRKKMVGLMLRML